MRNLLVDVPSKQCLRRPVRLDGGTRAQLIKEAQTKGCKVSSLLNSWIEADLDSYLTPAIRAQLPQAKWISSCQWSMADPFVFKLSPRAVACLTLATEHRAQSHSAVIRSCIAARLASV